MPIAAQSGGGGSLLPLLMIVALFGVMYFMMIRPQQRRRREAEQMQSSLGPGDEVVTIGGMHGIVASVDDEDGTVTLEVASEVYVRFARQAIARVVTSVAHSTPDEPDEATETDATADDTAGEADQAERSVDGGSKKD